MNRAFGNNQFRVHELTRQLAVMLLGALLLTVSACRPTDMRGAATKETLVDLYLQALQQSDEQAMLLLVPETLAAQEAIQARIEQLGGHAFHGVDRNYAPQVHPQWVTVLIRGFYAGSKSEQIEFRDKVNLHQIDGRWYLMLGQDRNAVPPPPTSQP